AGAAEDDEVALAGKPLHGEVEVVEVHVQVDLVEVDAGDRGIALEGNDIGQAHAVQAPFEAERGTDAIAAAYVEVLRAVLRRVLRLVEAGGDAEVALGPGRCRDAAGHHTRGQQDGIDYGPLRTHRSPPSAPILLSRSGTRCPLGDRTRIGRSQALYLHFCPT